MSISRRHSLGATARRAFHGLRRAARTIARGVTVALTLAAAGCGSYEEEVSLSEVIPAAATVAPKPEPTPAQPKFLGKFRMTFYYVAREEEVPEPAPLVASAEPGAETGSEPGAGTPGEAAEPGSEAAGDTVLAAMAPEKITLYDRECNELARVTPRFLAHLNMQGTGKLRDGRTLNIGKVCDCPHSPCYRLVEGQRWGYAGNGRVLLPFRTVAVDPRKIKLGSLLYVAELDGRTMPGRPPWGGFVHDGCVVGDDTGGGVQGRQLDLFVGRRAYYKALGKRGGSHAWARSVTVYDGSTRCKRSGGRVSKSQRGAI